MARLENVLNLAESQGLRAGIAVRTEGDLFNVELQRQASFFELMIREALATVAAIQEDDMQFRESLMSNPDDWSAGQIDAKEAELFGSLQDWLRVSRRLKTELDSLVSRGADVVGASDFNETLRSVERMLIPDHEFFVGPELEALENEAIRSFRDGLVD